MTRHIPICHDCGTPVNGDYKKCPNCGSRNIETPEELMSQFWDSQWKNPVPESLKTFCARLETDGFASLLANPAFATKNTNYSPVSLAYALGMALEMSDSSKRADLCKLFGISSWNEVRQGFQSFITRYQDNPQAEGIMANLLLVNSATVPQGCEIPAAEQLKEFYFAEEQVGDFARETTRAAVSKWIAEATQNRLSFDEQLNPNAVLVLINALALTCSWADKFEKSRTKPRTFYGLNESFEAPFMHISYSNVSCCIGRNFQRITLDCSGGYCVDFVLPDKRVSWADFIAKPKQVEKAFSKKDNKDVNAIIALPRFETESSFALKDTAKALGFGFMFESDGSGMKPLNGEPLVVDEIAQKTRLKVDEEGFEGAAFTEVLLCLGLGAPDELKTVEFTFDRPFLYRVRSDEGVTIFTGTVVEPERVLP